MTAELLQANTGVSGRERSKEKETDAIYGVQTRKETRRRVRNRREDEKSRSAQQLKFHHLTVNRAHLQIAILYLCPNRKTHAITHCARTRIFLIRPPLIVNEPLDQRRLACGLLAKDCDLESRKRRHGSAGRERIMTRPTQLVDDSRFARRARCVHVSLEREEAIPLRLCTERRCCLLLR